MVSAAVAQRKGNEHVNYLRGLSKIDPKEVYDLVVKKVNTIGLPHMSYDWSQQKVRPSHDPHLIGRSKSTVTGASANALQVRFQNTSIFTILVYPFGDYLVFQTYTGQVKAEYYPSGNLWELQEELFFTLVGNAVDEAIVEFGTEHQDIAPSPEKVFGGD